MSGRTIERIRSNEGDAAWRQGSFVTNAESVSKLGEEQGAITFDGAKIPTYGFTTLSLFGYVTHTADATFDAGSITYTFYRRTVVNGKDVFAKTSTGSVSLTGATYTLSGDVVVPATVSITNDDTATHIAFTGTTSAPSAGWAMIELGKLAAL